MVFRLSPLQLRGEWDKETPSALSAYLFIMVLEILCIGMLHSKDIHGI